MNFSSLILPGVVGDNAGLFAILAIWSLVWKGLALWRAAQKGQKGWYVALLILNTVGILEIIYLYVISPKQTKPTAPTPSETL